MAVTYLILAWICFTITFIVSPNEFFRSSDSLKLQRRRILAMHFFGGCTFAFTIACLLSIIYVKIIIT